MSNNRIKFASKLGLIAAAAGSAVGLGNIWRFPSQVADGGGAIFILLFFDDNATPMIVRTNAENGRA